MMAEHVNKNERDYFEKRISQLKSERSSFDSHWRDLSRYIQPRRGRFSTSDKNKGEKRNQNIVNATATLALRTAKAGLLAGTMSAARPWFELGTDDPELVKRIPVKVWLRQVEELMRLIFNASNFYAQAPVILGEILLFGTGAMTHVDDFDTVAHFGTQTVGSYWIGQNDKLEVNTLVREWEMTVEQMVNEFTLGNVPKQVSDAYHRGDYLNWHKITQFIEPNPDFDPASPLSAKKRFRSVKYTPAEQDKSKFLSRKGFDEFPAHVVRWDVTGEDIYGTDCPGMTVLGDVRGLQIEEKRKAQGIDKQVNPPLQGPASLRNIPISALPGGSTIFDSGDGKGIRPLYEVRPQVEALSEDIKNIERRIEDGFYVNLFLAISNMEGIQPKNVFELNQRNAERLLQLGPVLERIQGDLLDKLINRLFAQMVRAGILPPAPPELQDADLKVTYISALAQAQRAVATGSIERLAGFVGNLAQFKPDVVDKFDADKAAEEFAEVVGTPPLLIVPQDVVDERREARAKAAAQAQQIEDAKTIGAAIKDSAQALETSGSE